MREGTVPFGIISSGIVPNNWVCTQHLGLSLDSLPLGLSLGLHLGQSPIPGTEIPRLTEALEGDVLLSHKLF